MTTPTTPAEAVAQWCEANGWTKNPEFIPAGTRFVSISSGAVTFDSSTAVDLDLRGEPERFIRYADLPKPVLPTEPGSLIVDVTLANGDHYDHLVLGRSFWSGRTDAGEWYASIHPEHITSWHPGKAVRADA